MNEGLKLTEVDKKLTEVDYSKDLKRRWEILDNLDKALVRLSDSIEGLTLRFETECKG